MNIDRVGDAVGEHAGQPASGRHFSVGEGRTVVNAEEDGADDKGNFDGSGAEITVDEGGKVAFHGRC